MKTTTGKTKDCPYCGETVLAVAMKCRYCKEYLDPAMRKRKVKANRPSTAESLLLPVGRSAWAICAGYFGLFALLPIFSPFAILISLGAILHLRSNPKLLGWGRAIFGLCMGIVTTMFYGILILKLAS